MCGAIRRARTRSCLHPGAVRSRRSPRECRADAPPGTHTGTASRRTRSRIRAFRPRSVTTSTGRPSSASSSNWRPPRSSSDQSGSSSTRKSTSLWASDSLRAPLNRRRECGGHRRSGQSEARPLVFGRAMHQVPWSAPSLPAMIARPGACSGILDKPLHRRPARPHQQPRLGIDHAVCIGFAGTAGISNARPVEMLKPDALYDHLHGLGTSAWTRSIWRMPKPI